MESAIQKNLDGESVAPVLTAVASDADVDTGSESAGNQSDECATPTSDQLPPPLDACNSSSQRVISSGAATAREPPIAGLLEASTVEDEATADVHGRTASADAVVMHAKDRYSSSRSLVGAFDSSHQWQCPATAEDAHAASPRVPLPLTEATTIALSDSTVSPRTLEATTEATVTQEHEQLERRHSKQSRRANDVVSHATLVEIQAFLTAKIQENQLNTPEIHEFVEQRLSEQQQRRHLPPLLQLLTDSFARESSARGDADLSVDVQSALCLLEQSFLTAGRVSPLQDMYTAEEEALLDQLALLPISSADTT